MTATSSGAKTMTRRRAETQRRLIEAAYEVFAEVGIRDAPVEAICDRAGFSRGAFYSNFASKEELFLAVYEVQMQERVDRLRAAVDEAVSSVDPADPEAVATVSHTTGMAFMESLASDRRWYVLYAEFRAQALRQPELHALTAAAEGRFRDALASVLVHALDRTGMRLTIDPSSAIIMIIALYEAMLARALIEELPSTVLSRYLSDAVRMFTALIVPGDTATCGATTG